MNDKPEILYLLGHHPSRPDRWALINPTGAVTNWFDLATRPRDKLAAELAPQLARHGLVLREDNTIVRAADLAGATPIAQPASIAG